MTQKPAAGPEEEPEQEIQIPSISALPALDITSSPVLTKQSMQSVITPGRIAGGALLANSRVFFGPTSFSAVFHEELGTSFHASAEAIGLEDATRLNLGPENDPLDTHFVRLGTKALRRLPDQQTCNLLLARYLHANDNDGWFKPATQQCADLLYSMYGKGLSGSRTVADCEHVATILCHTGRTTLQEPNDPDDSREWVSSFSGANLRWEALGMVLSSCCYGALASPDGDVFAQGDGQRKDRMQFVHELKESISICVTLCSHTDFVNLVMVSLLHSNCHLVSVLNSGGDTSKFPFIVLHPVI